LISEWLHSTPHQLRRVVLHVKGRRGQKLPKLLARGCDISLARLIFYFLKKHCFQVCVGKAQSLSCNIPYGVPQVAILSPTLYTLFTSDILNLQNQLDSFSDYLKDCKIRINPTVTPAIFFTRRFSPRMLLSSNLRLNNQEIPWSFEVKYLGLPLHRLPPRR
jgi:hypothetical protein